VSPPATRASSSIDTFRGSDRILLFTRVVAVAVVLVLAFGFISLLGFPGETDRHFAWTIHTQMTSMALGSGYASGAYFFTWVALGRRWHEVHAGFLPIAAFTVLMELATILHWSVFLHGTFRFGFWLAIYSITPILVPLTWWINRPADPKYCAQSDRMPPRLRAGLAIWGGGMLAMTAFLYLAPGSAADVWPWPLTALTSRVLGAWFVWGTVGLVLARDGRWSGARVPIQATIAGSILTLIGVARTWSEWASGRTLTYIVLVALAAVVLGMGGLHLAQDRRRATASGQGGASG
jgi:hypothetical protein